MPAGIGGPELIVILLLAVLLFGAKKLPDLGRSMGQSITNFKRGINEAKAPDQLPADTPQQPAATSEPAQPTAESRQP